MLTSGAMLTATGRAGPGGAAPSPDLEDAYRVCERIVRGHYENFPVASKFIPKASRRALAAVYAFARRADDYADEGYGPGGPTQSARFAALDGWERRLERACGEAPPSGLPGESGASLPGLPGSARGQAPPCRRRPQPDGSPIERAGSTARPAAADADAIFLALADAIRQHDIPPALFHDLLSAFRQDVAVDEYATRSDLLDYCRRSANPVGRIVLAVHGVHGEPLLAWSDAICTGLQLANFWQDAGVDRAKSRIYLPREDRERFGVSPGDLDAPADARRAARARAGGGALDPDLLRVGPQAARGGAGAPEAAPAPRLERGRPGPGADRETGRRRPGPPPEARAGRLGPRLPARGASREPGLMDPRDAGEVPPVSREKSAAADGSGPRGTAHVPHAGGASGAGAAGPPDDEASRRGPVALVRAMTRRSGSNFYYAFLLLPKEKREAIYAVYAFAREVDDAVDEAPGPAQARERLAAWEEEVSLLDAGTPRHPVMRAVARARERFPIPIESMRALLEGARMDLERQRYATFDELRAYCERVASAVGLMCIEIFGYGSPSAKPYAVDLGIALQLTNILRDLGSDARRGRLYLPLDELAPVRRPRGGPAGGAPHARGDGPARVPGRARGALLRIGRRPARSARPALAGRGRGHEADLPPHPRPDRSRLLRRLRAADRSVPAAQGGHRARDVARLADMTGAADVIVVGAGVAGLAAATRLAGAGARVLVLEASRIPGGRARSWTDPATGATVDNGQHLLMGCYAETLALLERIGSRGLVRFQERLRVEFVDRDGDGGAIDCPPLPGRLSLLAGLALYRGLTPGGARGGPGGGARGAARRVRSRGRGARAGGSAGGIAIAGADGTGGAAAGAAAGAGADETVAAWLSRRGQSALARRNFWDPLVLATLNEDPERASARALRTVLRIGLLGGPEASRLGWARAGLGELFAEPAEAWLRERGGSIRFPAPVSAVRPGRDGVEVETRGGERLEARSAILAVPPAALLRIVPPSLAGDPALAGAAKLGTSPILGVNLWFDRPIVEGPFYALLGTTMQWLFNRSLMLDRAGEGAESEGRRREPGGEGAGRSRGGAADVERGGFVTLVASGARREVERTPEELTGTALAELRALFPAARRARLLRSLVVKERDATISPAAGWDLLRPGARTPEPRLFLAGDWTATGLPATIESAALSGHRAAAALLESW